MTQDEAIKKFQREYYKACANESIDDPVSEALFRTWAKAKYSDEFQINGSENIEQHVLEMILATKQQMLLRKRMEGDKRANCIIDFRTLQICCRYLTIRYSDDGAEQICRNCRPEVPCDIDHCPIAERILNEN